MSLPYTTRCPAGPGPASMLRLLCLPVVACALAGCALSSQRGPMSGPEQTVAQRRMQAERYDDVDEVAVMRASIAMLQDLGFMIDASDEHLGIIVGSKDRTAFQIQQFLAAMVLAGLIQTYVPWDDHQFLRASIITRPTEGGVAVRATFQRVVWNSEGYISKLEAINDPEIYRVFFEKLARALWLERSI